MAYTMPVGIDETKEYTTEEAGQMLPGRHGQAMRPNSVAVMCRQGRIKAKRRNGVWFIPGKALKELIDGVGR